MIADKTNGLPRFCHPYHGGWDVARIALDIPESRILFVCPISCARIICLNAIKYEFVKVGKVFTRSDFEPYAEEVGL